MCEARGPMGCHLTLVLYLAVTGKASVFPDVSYPELGLRVWAFSVLGCPFSRAGGGLVGEQGAAACSHQAFTKG